MKFRQLRALVTLEYCRLMKGFIMFPSRVLHRRSIISLAVRNVRMKILYGSNLDV